MKKNEYKTQTENIDLSVFLGQTACHSSEISSILRNNKQSKLQIFDAHTTLLALYRALIFLRYLTKKNQDICVLFVNTNPEFGKIVKKSALFSKQHYINTKWVGGTLTNWKQISKTICAYQQFYMKWDSLIDNSIMKFPRFEKMQKCFHGYYNQLKILNFKEGFEFKKRHFEPKKNLIPLRRFLNAVTTTKLQQSMRLLYIENSKTISSSSIFEKQRKNTKMKTKVNSNKKWSLKKPDVLIILDPFSEKTALEEAQLANIPVIAFVNSDTSLKRITFPIPSNNQNHYWIHFCLNWMTKILKKAQR